MNTHGACPQQMSDSMYAMTHASVVQLATYDNRWDKQTAIK